MKLDEMHNYLVDHYKKYRSIKTKRSIQIQSIVGQSLKKRPVQVQQMSPFEDFLRNQSQIVAQQPPLYIRQLPRKLKVHFPGPPEPPPKLQQIPYTRQTVPNVPFRMPRQKPGQVGQWVIEQSRFVDRQIKKKNKSMIQNYRRGDRQQTKGKVVNQHDRRNRFRSQVKKLVVKMRQKNLTLRQIIKNKGLTKKPHNFYNSVDFFLMCRSGDEGVEKLLQNNPQLAFDVDQQQMTGLHWAARQGHTSVCRILIQKFRANCNSKDCYGRTPLHLAVQNKNVECIIRIFIQGGSLGALNKDKKSVRMVANDAYIKYLLQKLEQIKFVIKTKSYSRGQEVRRSHKQIIEQKQQQKRDLQKAIRNTLDESSLYF